MAKPLEQQSREELIEYIKALRIEAQENREEAEVYTSVFHKLGPAEQRGLLHMVQTFVEDPKAGAELFADLSASILGSSETKPEATPKEDTTMADPTDDSTPPAWFQGLVTSLDQRFSAIEAQLQAGASASEEAEIRAYKAQAKSYGFVEGTDEWYRFFEIAASGLAGDGDLEAAKAIYEKLEGPLPGATTEPAAEEEEAPVKEAKTFPKAAAAPAPSAPTPEPMEIDTSKAGTKQAALDFLTKAMAPGLE